MPFVGKAFLVAAAISGMLAVAIGALGAHALKHHIPEALFSAYMTAVQYHFYHTLVLVGVSVLLLRSASKWLSASGILFVIGIVLFSGSLYGLALGGPSWLGPVTPLGGVCFIFGWVALLLAAIRL